MQILKGIKSFLGLDTAQMAEAAGSTSDVAASAAFKRLALYIAVQYLAKAISKSEFRTYEGGKQVKGELYYALNVSPNPNTSAPALKCKLVEQCIYDGAALMFQPRRSRNWFYVADSFSVVEQNPLGEDVYGGVVVDGQGCDLRFRASDACRFALERKSAAKLVSSMYQDMGAMLAMAMESFKQANGEKFFLEKDYMQSGDAQRSAEERREAADRIKDFVRSPNGVLPQYSNEKLVRLQPKQTGNAAAEDVINLRRDIFELTAQALCIPQAMMYGNMTNAKDIVTQFVTFGVDPWANMIGAEMTRKFYGFEAWDSGRTRIEVNTNTITHLDMFEVADKVEKLLSSGAASIDELRPSIGLDLLDTDYSQAHWMTKNYSLIQDALDQLATQTASGGGEK